MTAILNKLKTYFEERKDVAFAFLFGSAAKSKVRKQGDIDIAVYFWPENKIIEWEMFGKYYPGEARIALDIERILKKNIDLIVLNRARSILADEIIRKGIPIIIKDKGLFFEFLCIITDEAEYMREFIESYYLEVKSGR